MGNLLIYGIGCSGTTTALRTVLLSLAARRSPASVHIYVVDLGAGELAALSALPHTGAYVPAPEGERRMWLLRFLRAEAARRRPHHPALLAADTEIHVSINSYAPVMTEFDYGTKRASIDYLLPCLLDRDR